MENETGSGVGVCQEVSPGRNGEDQAHGGVTRNGKEGMGSDILTELPGTGDECLWRLKERKELEACG